jgi:hypothetical protein
MNVGHYAFNFRCIPFRAGWSPHVNTVSLNSYTRLVRVDRQKFLRLDTFCIGGCPWRRCCDVVKSFGHYTCLEEWLWSDTERHLTSGCISCVTYRPAWWIRGSNNKLSKYKLPELCFCYKVTFEQNGRNEKWLYEKARSLCSRLHFHGME